MDERQEDITKKRRRQTMIDRAGWIAAGEEILRLAEEAHKAEKRAEGYRDLVNTLIGLNRAIDEYWMKVNVAPVLEWQKKSEELLKRLGEL